MGQEKNTLSPRTALLISDGAESRTDGAQRGGQERVCAGGLSAVLVLGCS